MGSHAIGGSSPNPCPISMRTVPFELPRCDLDCVYTSWVLWWCQRCSEWRNPVMPQSSIKRGQNPATTMHIDDKTESPGEQIIQIVESSVATIQKVDSVHNIDLPALERYVRGLTMCVGVFEPTMCSRESSTWPQCACLHLLFDCIVLCSFLASNSKFDIGQRTAWLSTFVESVACPLLSSKI